MNQLNLTDIDKVVKKTKLFSQYFSGKRILLTGGNGFIGKYFLEIFKEYNKFLKKDLSIGPIVGVVYIKEGQNRGTNQKIITKM